MAGAIASLCPFTGTKVSPCEFRHSARTGSERFLDTACEHPHTACQKSLGIYLRLRRSGELRCVRAGVLAQYLTRHRKYHGFASARTDINGKQTHDGFRFHLLCREGVSSNCWDTSRSAQGKTSLHRNLFAATESFRPRAPDSTTSIFLFVMETLATPRNISGTSNNKIRNRT